MTGIKDRSRASGQDTRRRILAAAGELFSARGYEDVTIRDIAAAADADQNHSSGVSGNTLSSMDGFCFV